MESDGPAIFNRFLKEYCANLKENIGEDTAPPIRFTNPHVCPDEVEGECLDWCLNFLTTRQCPAVPAAALAHAVYSRVSSCDLSDFLDAEDEEVIDGSQSSEICRPAGDLVNGDKEYRAEALHKFVMATLDTVMLDWMDHPPSLTAPSTVYECSVHAIKNTRRTMEDGHVIVPDLNTLFGLEDQPNQSFYAIFDGHAGVGAAMYAARQLHCNLVRRCSLDTDPDAALKSAFRLTDESFVTKARKQRWRSGSTCVSALIRDGRLYLAWLGDSQAVLVRGGRVVTHLEPHKPDRQDERDRIQALGGCVMLVGDMWRVGGNLAVSRAIGDVGYKPFVSNECEVISMELDGTEDYVVLACDGAWDAITYDALPGLVYNYLQETNNERANVAKMLVQYAKDNDSTDNISVIVVFFREHIAVPKPDIGLFDFLGAETSLVSNETSSGDNAPAPGSQQGTTHSGAGGNNSQPQGDNSVQSLTDHQGNEDDHDKMVPPSDHCVPGSYDKAPGDVDLDYYGVFDTRLVDGPVDLSFLDMPNSSDLLKGIAETMYSGEYDIMVPEVHIRRKNVIEPQQEPEPDIATEQLDLTIAPDKKVAKPNVEKQRHHKHSRTGSSPVCWAFAGKNRASVQNYRLNQAAKASMRGPISLSEMSMAAKGIVRYDNLPKIARSLQGNENASKQNTPRPYNQPPGITVFGSKSTIQTESKKFHTSWRPRKPLKSISIVYDAPPSAFLQNKLDSIR